MRTVPSKDGTVIAYDQWGGGHLAHKGPQALILVSGALGYRAFAGSVPLAERLAQHFTVINDDRRGRGDSGDTPPYAVQREVEDLEALMNAVGGSAFVHGLSSGAVLALEAASRLPTRVKKLALYEPPFILDDSRPPVPEDYLQHLNEAIAAGRRGDAVEIFMTEALLIPAELVAHMRHPPASEHFGDDAGTTSPEWAALEKVAHTLPYDAMIMGDTQSGKPYLPRRWASATSPALVVTGEKSEAFFLHAAQALVALLPNAQHRILEGQGHAVAPEAIAPILIEFFKA